MDEIKLDAVYGSKHCQYSVIENKLEILYRNQEKLLQAIKLIHNNPQVPLKSVETKRFSINKTILSDFALFAIVDNELNKVVCHLVYDNGEEYCEEMANKMLFGLNS